MSDFQSTEPSSSSSSEYTSAGLSAKQMVAIAVGTIGSVALASCLTGAAAGGSNNSSRAQTTQSNFAATTSGSYGSYKPLDRFFSAGSKRSLTVSSTYLQSSPSPNVEVSPSNPTSPLRDFETSSLDGRIIKTLQATRMFKPTPIQAHAIPLLIAGHDVMASSHTGSGKTLMFGLPLLQSIIKVSNERGNGTMGRPSKLVIAPTRELAIQIEGVLKSFKSMQLNICLATGGSDTRLQRQRLPSCHVLVGTPGRIVQFIDERNLSLGDTDFIVIDEADRMLDLGFEKELTRIARSTSKQKQSVLCSATFPDGVQRLAADFLRPDYYFVSVGRVGSTQAKASKLNSKSQKKNQCDVTGNYVGKVGSYCVNGVTGERLDASEEDNEIVLLHDDRNFIRSRLKVPAFDEVEDFTLVEYAANGAPIYEGMTVFRSDIDPIIPSVLVNIIFDEDCESFTKHVRILPDASIELDPLVCKVYLEKVED